MDATGSEADLEEESREKRTRPQRLERLVDPAGFLGAPSKYVRVDSPHTLAPGVLDLVVRRKVRHGRERDGQVGVVGVVVVDFRRCVGGSASSRSLREQEATCEPKSATSSQMRLFPKESTSTERGDVHRVRRQRAAWPLPNASEPVLELCAKECAPDRETKVSRRQS
jgi:hypothetical protein